MDRTLLLLGAVILSLSYSSAIRKENYPNIQSAPSSCWNRSTSPPSNLHVCDPDRTISAEDVRELQREAMSIQNNTNCPCHSRQCAIWGLTPGKVRGYTLSVAIVNSMDVTQSNKVEAAKDYVEYIRTRKGFYGWDYSSRCEEDIIIFLSVEDTVVYVLTGNKARSRANDGELSAIITNSKPSFSRSLTDGLKYLIREIREELKRP